MSFFLNLKTDALKRAVSIKEQIADLETELAQLLNGTGKRRGRPKNKVAIPVVAAEKKKRTMSAAAKKKMAAAAKARWAAAKAAGKSRL